LYPGLKAADLIARWSRQGVWEAMHRLFADDLDRESILIDKYMDKFSKKSL
jgi:hypothetical protein